MAFNFTQIVAEEQRKQEQNNKSGSGGSSNGFKTVYPFANGRLEFKFIGNEPSGMLYRELHFHEYWADNKRQKVPCLKHMYGMECPICKMVEEVQNTLDNKDVWRKYGCKTQGIMFAKLINYSPDNYFGDNNNPAKPGDIVVFMFPKSVISELRNLIIEFSDEIDVLFTNNTTRNVSLKVGTQANGFPEYTFFVKNNTTTLCVDNDGNPDESAFTEFMAKMPNLKDTRFPKEPTEDIMKIHRVVTEQMSKTYFGENTVKESFSNAAPMGSVAQTTTTPATTIPTPGIDDSLPFPEVKPDFDLSDVNELKSVDEIIADKAADTETNDVNTGERPPCFGNNQYDEKCSKCPWDSQCI